MIKTLALSISQAISSQPLYIRRLYYYIMHGLAELGFGLIIGIFFIIISIIAIAIAAFVFWLLMLIDCVKRDFKGENDKVVWVLLMIFLHILASILYYFIIKAKDKKKK